MKVGQSAISASVGPDSLSSAKGQGMNKAWMEASRLEKVPLAIHESQYCTPACLQHGIALWHCQAEPRASIAD